MQAVAGIGDAGETSRLFTSRRLFAGSDPTYRGDHAIPATTGNQVSIVSPNVGRIALDNFAVLRYGRPPVGDQGFQVRDLQVACRFNASHFTLHNFNPLNEILYCFSRKSVPWFNLDTLAYKRFGTNAGADTQAASERAARKI